MTIAELNNSGFGTPFTVSVEARTGVTTGISAADRARTVQVLIDPTTRPEDLARPGHMFPLRARRDGVLVRAGQTEASVDLARLAGLVPAGVICEILNPDGTMARRSDLHAMASRLDVVFGHYEVKLNRVENAGGRHAGMVQVLRDVTPLRVAEAELASRQAILDSILSSTTDAIALFDVGGSIVWVNGVSEFLRGGATYTSDIIPRFYALHMLLIPGALMGLIGLHMYLVTRLGVTPAPWKDDPANDPEAWS